jgi:hypothetical protein
MAAKGNDNGFLLKGKNGGLRRRPGLPIRNRGSLPPLGDGLRVDPMTIGQGPQALLTMLYRSTDCRCRAGAPVKNLSHSASFWRSEKYAPSNFGTKHLICPQRARWRFRAHVNGTGSIKPKLSLPLEFNPPLKSNHARRSISSKAHAKQPSRW